MTEIDNIIERVNRAIGWLQGFSPAIWAMNTVQEREVVGSAVVGEYDKIVSDLSQGVARGFQLLLPDTCQMTLSETGEMLAYDCREYFMHCGACHHEFGYLLFNEDGNAWMDEKPKHCPNCGRSVQ